MFIADEIQTGFARTGAMFACEHEGVVPDLITTAKALGGGMPLSAVTGRAELMDTVPAGGLGGTYAGNPVACAAAWCWRPSSASSWSAKRKRLRLRRCPGLVRGLELTPPSARSAAAAQC